MKARLQTILVTAALTTGPSAAFADCAQHRLVGSWRAYVTPTANTWLACDFKVRSDGSFKSDSKCVGSGVGTSPVTGSLRIANCVITGQFNVSSRTYAIKHASFNVDQSQIAGVIRLANGRFVEFKSLRQ